MCCELSQNNEKKKKKHDTLVEYAGNSYPHTKVGKWIQ